MGRAQRNPSPSRVPIDGYRCAPPILRAIAARLRPRLDGAGSIVEERGWGLAVGTYPDDETLDLERRQFYEAVGWCITSWSNVEHELLGLLELCLKGSEMAMGRTVFYSIENWRSKVGAIDSTLSVALGDHPVWSEWSGKGGILQRINTNAKHRNTMAHSMMLCLPKAKAGQRYYLLRTLFDPKRPHFVPTRPTHGYFTHDLKRFAEDFNELARAIRTFGGHAEEPVKQSLRSFQQRRHRMMDRLLRSQTPGKRGRAP
jgi:hypothetical protein